MVAAHWVSLRQFLRALFTMPKYFEAASKFSGYGQKKVTKELLSPEAMVYLGIIRKKLDDISFVSYDAREAVEKVLNEVEEKFCVQRVETRSINPH